MNMPEIEGYAYAVLWCTSPHRALLSEVHVDGCHCSGGVAAQLIASGCVKETHETESLLRVSSMWLMS